MEPVYMVLGQTAGTAAVMALDRKMDVQDLGYDQLKTQLLKDGQVLSLDRKITADIVIYGGTSSAITAAVQKLNRVRRMSRCMVASCRALVTGLREIRCFSGWPIIA
jgi:CO dehydrogenase/acetyl-CoA synthase epsilon subunit